MNQPHPDGPHAYERGMTLNIFRPHGPDASGGGVSSRCDQVTVTRILDRTGAPGPHAMRPVPASCRVSTPGDLRPEAVLVLMEIMGSLLLYVSPWQSTGRSGPPLMGGCYVTASDTRWAKLVEAELGHAFYGALPLHDRWEH